MAGIQTSRITTDSGDDLTIQPAAGKKTLLKSVTSDNPGETPLVTKSDGEVQKLDISQLEDIGGLAEDADWLMVHDVSDSNKIKKISAAEVLGGGISTFLLPNFPDPLPSNGLWVDVDSVLAVQAGGNGSTLDLQNSVEFAVANQTFDQTDKNVTLGQSVYIRWIESKLISANHGQTISGTLYAKSGSNFTQTWNLTIVKQPTGGWDLVDLFDQPVSSQVTSALATPTGMNAPSPVTIDGGTLTSIEVSINGGAFTQSPGNIESGQTIAVRGTTGASNSTGYTALVSIGGAQVTWTVTTVAAVAAVAQPSIVNPAGGATGLGNSITATSSAYQALNGAGAHLNSDWELKKAGVVVSSSMASASDKESWTIPSGDLEENTTYTIRVRYRSSDGIVSSYSAESSFTTGTFTLDPGTPIGGGFLVGMVQYNAAEEDPSIGSTIYYLITSPKSVQFSKKFKGVYMENPSEAVKESVAIEGWVESPTGAVPWRKNGRIATNTMASEGNKYPACKEVKALSDAGIGGYHDWYVPTTYEHAYCYYQLKPSNANHQTGSGGQYMQPAPMAYPIPMDKPTSPTSPPYKCENPLFQGPSGAEAYTAGNDHHFWCSTMYWAWPYEAEKKTTPFAILFANGYNTGRAADISSRTRPVRIMAV